LKLSCGLTVTLVLNEATGAFSCEWSEPPTKAMIPGIGKEYLPWRNEIIEEWTQRTGKRVLVIDL
jgi:hypothetical protein